MLSLHTACSNVKVTPGCSFLYKCLPCICGLIFLILIPFNSWWSDGLTLCEWNSWGYYHTHCCCGVDQNGHNISLDTSMFLVEWSLQLHWQHIIMDNIRLVVCGWVLGRICSDTLLSSESLSELRGFSGVQSGTDDVRRRSALEAIEYLIPKEVCPWPHIA